MDCNLKTSLLVFRLNDPCAFCCCQIRDKLEKPVFLVTTLEFTCFNAGVNSLETNGREVAGISTWPIHWVGQTCRSPRAFFFRTFASIKLRLRDPSGPENAKIQKR